MARIQISAMGLKLFQPFFCFVLFNVLVFKFLRIPEHTIRIYNSIAKEDVHELRDKCNDFYMQTFNQTPENDQAGADTVSNDELLVI